jgi:hypothetical protein
VSELVGDAGAGEMAGVTGAGLRRRGSGVEVTDGDD